MARRGRIGKNKPVITEENQKLADHFMSTFSIYYEDYRKKFKVYGYDDDLLNTTLLLCYECIQRNGLKDTTEQGVKNYFFRAYNSNLTHFRDPYDQRKNNNHIFTDEAERDTAEEKWNKQLYRDYQALYVLKAAEEQFDKITFWVFKIKHLVPKTSYKKLRDITGIKDCKKRVTTVNKWLRENMTKEEVREAFERDFPDLLN